jgi:hypothetical protein
MNFEIIDEIAEIETEEFVWPSFIGTKHME